MYYLSTIIKLSLVDNIYNLYIYLGIPIANFKTCRLQNIDREYNKELILHCFLKTIN